MSFINPNSYPQQGTPGGMSRAGSICSLSPSMALPTSTVEISVRCEKLSDQDVMSKSDPLCVMFQQMKNKPGTWIETGRTEMIQDTLDPEWQTKFIVDFSFEERQVVKFEVYDWDTSSNRLSDHDFLGRVETTLGSIVSASNGQFASMLKDGPSKKSKIFIIAEELEINKEVIQMQFSGEKLDKKDFFGKSDPYYVISKGSSSGKWVVVHKSEVIKNTLNPSWKPINISVRNLCNNKKERALKIDVYDWNSNGSPDMIGTYKTDLNKLTVSAAEKENLPLVNEKKTSKKSYKNSGVLLIKSFNVTQEYSFLDYIQHGTSMNFSVAVDFTASNGNPRDPRSLHYMQPGYVDNQYTTAIRSVGSIIEDYDTDKMFPALGFGAKVPPNYQVSHEFFLNLHPENPYCSGVDGLLAAYNTSLQSVQLYGPTNFAPVIQHTMKFAQAFQDGKQYFTLLIITDGIITDMEQTKWAIINASIYPMSIIIVGVGNEDFSSMEELDSDDGLLRHGGKVASRDIVQFVELRKFISKDGLWDKELLAKDVLAEVPGQVVGWMKMRNIKPQNQ